ncbi:MAG: hypothetical protein HY777_12540 [Betaproteobacteria bacterium]|nr:hypothetical protein [Betaproteobacteria bacterium]
MSRVRVCAVALAAILGGCAVPEPAPAPIPEPAPAEPETVAKKPGSRPERIVSQPLKHLANRNLKAMPVRALNVQTKCAFNDAVGTRGKLDLQVKNAEVQRFNAEVNISKRGICRFDIKNFRQTARLPAVLLNDRESGCLVRMWEQDKSVTVAFNGCEAQCSGESFSYLWPILVDTRNGRCF